MNFFFGNNKKEKLFEMTSFASQEFLFNEQLIESQLDESIPEFIALGYTPYITFDNVTLTYLPEQRWLLRWPTRDSPLIDDIDSLSLAEPSDNTLAFLRKKGVHQGDILSYQQVLDLLSSFASEYFNVPILLFSLGISEDEQLHQPIQQEMRTLGISQQVPVERTQYPIPVNIAPYESQWIALKISEIINNQYQESIDVCLADFPIISYLIGRLSNPRGPTTVGTLYGLYSTRPLFDLATLAGYKSALLKFCHPSYTSRPSRRFTGTVRG